MNRYEALEAAAHHFVAKVDTGKAHSVESYRHFSEALALPAPKLFFASGRPVVSNSQVWVDICVLASTLDEAIDTVKRQGHPGFDVSRLTWGDPEPVTLPYFVAADWSYD